MVSFLHLIIIATLQSTNFTSNSKLHNTKKYSIKKKDIYVHGLYFYILLYIDILLFTLVCQKKITNSILSILYPKCHPPLVLFVGQDFVFTCFQDFDKVGRAKSQNISFTIQFGISGIRSHQAHIRYKPVFKVYIIIRLTFVTIWLTLYI